MLLLGQLVVMLPPPAVGGPPSTAASRMLMLIEVVVGPELLLLLPSCCRPRGRWCSSPFSVSCSRGRWCSTAVSVVPPTREVVLLLGGRPPLDCSSYWEPLLAIEESGSKAGVLCGGGITWGAGGWLFGWITWGAFRGRTKAGRVGLGGGGITWGALGGSFASWAAHAAGGGGGGGHRLGSVNAFGSIAWAR